MKKKVVIIGAGPAGLSTAYELLDKSDKYEVVIVEATSDIGGISKTVKYKGNRMDIGGHRFFSKEKRVNEFWDALMPIQGKPSYDDKKLHREKSLVKGGPDPEKTDKVRLKRTRISRIYYLKKFFDYPISLKLSTLKNMGFKNTIKCGFSYLKSIFIKKKEDSLENFYINRFGKKLYNMFFENYTEKLWGRHPSAISAEWGSQRVKGLSIISVLKNALKINKKQETSLIEEYTYPKLGPGDLWEKVAEEIKSKGGSVLYNHEVRKIGIENKKVKSIECSVKGKKVEIKGDIFVSSMPLKDLVLDMNNKVPNNIKNIAKGLPYRDFVTIGLLVKKLNLKNETNIPTLGNIVPDCWIYVQENNIKMGRIQIFNNWSPYMVKDPDNTVWIGLEYFCKENDDFWSMSDVKIKDLAVKELIEMGIINSDDVMDYHVEKVKKAYPAYFDTYKDIDKLRQYLNSFDNLYCVGRNGQHRYNNMDHSMMTGFLTADSIIAGCDDKTDIWNVNTESDFHEEKQNKKSNKKTIFNISLIVIYAVFTFLLALHHEMWRDEAQAWLLLKNLNFSTFLSQLKVEGHPILWYLMIKPFISLGLPYTKMFIISWLLSVITVGLFVKHYPYGNISKIIILLSLPFVYIAPVFVRSYTLTLFFMITISLLYKQRYKHPILYGLSLFGLFNTHIIFSGFLLGLISIHFLELLTDKQNRKPNLIILGLGILGLVLLIIQLFGASSSGELFSTLSYLKEVLIGILFNITKNEFLSYLLFVTNILCLFFLVIKKEFKMLWILLCGLGAMIIMMGAYSLNYYLCVQPLLIVLFVLWNLRNESKIGKLLLTAFFALNLFSSYSYIQKDWTLEYSASKETAEFIKNTIPDGSKIECLYVPYCSSLIPYLEQYDYTFIDTFNKKPFTFVDWNIYYDAYRFVNVHVNEEYFITSSDEESKYLNGYQVIYTSPHAIHESYYVYKQK